MVGLDLFVSLRISKVRESVLQIPKWSAMTVYCICSFKGKYAQILYLDLNFHPYKIGVVQVLNDTDPKCRLTLSQRLSTAVC